jgi:hypothetical protein
MHIQARFILQMILYVMRIGRYKVVHSANLRPRPFPGPPTLELFMKNQSRTRILLK